MKKILIIEDHADMRELLTWQIELMGFAAVTARQGREGLQKAQSENPVLIILDIMMPARRPRIFQSWRRRRCFATPICKTVWLQVAAVTLSSPLLFKSCKEKYRN